MHNKRAPAHCFLTQRERWDGAWARPEAAREVFGADEVHCVLNPDSCTPPLFFHHQRERWDGAWAGPEAAREVFGADEVYSTHELPRKLLEIAGAAPTIMFDFDRPGEWQQGACAGAGFLWLPAFTEFTVHAAGLRACF